VISLPKTGKGPKFSQKIHVLTLVQRVDCSESHFKNGPKGIWKKEAILDALRIPARHSIA
jgi:hypothetical protein